MTEDKKKTYFWRLLHLSTIVKINSNDYSELVFIEIFMGTKQTVWKIILEKTVEINVLISILLFKDGTMEIIANIKHFIILMRGRVFCIQVIDEEGKIMHPETIERYDVMSHFFLLRSHLSCLLSGKLAVCVCV